MSTGAVTAAAESQPLGFHALIMETLVVVHDRQQGNVMIGGSPETTGTHHKLAVLLIVDRDPAVLLICNGRADCRGRALADPVSAGTANELVMSVEVPQLQRPILEEGEIGNQRPIFVPDQRP